MSWLVSLYADVRYLPPAKSLVQQSPMFSDWEAVGGKQHRITLVVTANSRASRAKSKIT